MFVKWAQPNGMTTLFHTGDLGRMNGNGYLSITGEAEGAIQAGEWNIYSDDMLQNLRKQPQRGRLLIDTELFPKRERPPT
mmetsp:Transcript_8222/g.9661  ORF Transcript_8222/g.9661 Transcript_8222/m.9661 type:complete len:80 (-) Transcript_8222:38-277(-)